MTAKLPEKYRYIVIEGPIGAGKTSLVRAVLVGQLLREHVRAPRGWHRIADPDRPARTPASTIAQRIPCSRTNSRSTDSRSVPDLSKVRSRHSSVNKGASCGNDAGFSVNTTRHGCVRPSRNSGTRIVSAG